VRPRPGRHRHTAGPVAEPLAPLVSAIVPYFRLSAYVTETVESIFAQTHPRMEVVVVNDGSFGEADHVLGELVARFPLRIVHQTNHGLGSARNLGISQSRGRYVVPVDADNAIEPEFVARAVALLEAEPELAYVTAWSRYVDERGDDLHGAVSGYQPFGSRHDLGDLANVCGDALAVLPRRIFSLGFRYREDLTSYEDWQLYRELHAAGRFGTVIPERLIRYRVRGASMLQKVGLSHHERLLGEMAAHRREGEIAWT
jgi:glycosyltransferase involved in cell wall biosynthesis